MEFINATRMAAGYTMGIEPSGRELLVVVIKGTFRLPASAGEPLRLHEQQLPLVMADTFTGAPGLSAPVHEAEFAPRKRQVDVLLIGSAHAPGGRPAQRVPVGLRVNGITKTFAVVGDRQWEAGIGGLRITPTQPFTTMPISYDRAFGGVDDKHEDRRNTLRSCAIRRNGVHKHSMNEWLNGMPLPNTEELSRPVTSRQQYAPMSFGPIGRVGATLRTPAPTTGVAGEILSVLPADYDEQCYRCAAGSTASRAHWRTGSDLNLTPDGRHSFEIPAFEAPVVVFPQKGSAKSLRRPSTRRSGR